MGLTLKPEAVAERRRVFALHYARSGNGSASARAAGYRRPNEPARLLARPDVQLAVTNARSDPDTLANVRYAVNSSADTRRFHFACLYLEHGLHGTSAAKAVGYADPAWSATHLLRRDDVRQWIGRIAEAATVDPESKISKALSRLYAEAVDPKGGTRVCTKLAFLNQLRRDVAPGKT